MRSDKTKNRIALVGAGFIAQTHLQVLRALRREVEVVGICDVDRARAQDLARLWGLEEVWTSSEELIAQGRPEVVHILVPPDLHAQVAEPFLRAGIHVLLEKPMALSSAEAARLQAAASAGGVRLGVNHNATHYPIFRRLLNDIAGHRIGRVQHVNVLMNLPLRQLAAGDFSHWMFRHPRNIVFEQVPHPFSQIYKLIGPAQKVRSLACGKRQLLPGLDFYTTWEIALECERGTAQVFFAPGSDYAANRLTVIGQDGMADLDLLHDAYVLREKTRSEFFESCHTNRSAGRQWLRAGLASAAGYILSTLKLRQPRDLFYQGMLSSIRAFHRALRQGEGNGWSDAREGCAVIAMCEQASAAVAAPAPVPPPPAPPEREGEILILGASGFIGRHLVKRLRAAGQPLRVMVRRPHLLPPHLRDPEIRVLGGDITDREALARAVRGARAVYHLATGMGNTWEEMERLMIAGTRNVAEACLDAGVARLFYTSTIAAYYLGGREPIREDTPLDPRPAGRSLYARAKIECERLLLELRRERALDVAIFRPGVVVGEGGMATHSGVGLWLHDTRVLAWGRGDAPIPFVLAGDVADALARALDLADLEPRSFNLVGPVRLSAREYVEELSQVWQRNVRLYRTPCWRWQGDEICRWIVKRVIGRKAPFPSWRDLKTRALLAPFDCSRTEELLGWQPVSRRETFIELGIACHAPREAQPAESRPLRGGTCDGEPPPDAGDGGLMATCAEGGLEKED